MLWERLNSFTKASLAGKEVRKGTKRRMDSRGMTLVEMVVTFAVAAIFMVAAAALILPATRMTMHVKGMNRVHDDAAIIMETIVSELSFAEGKTDASSSAITLEDKIDDTGYYRKVSYTDKGGNPAEIRVGNDSDGEEYKEYKNRLMIFYSPITIGDETGEEIRPAIKWGYGKGLYQSNEIWLGFKKMDPSKNIITVKLTVTDPASGYSYTEEADIRCMNVEGANIKSDPP